MAPLVVGLGYDWAIKQTAKCIKELINLIHPEQVSTGDLLDAAEPKSARSASPPPVTITCKSADSLDHLADGSIDAVVMDPPYYDNVMYAELSDFFYVWLKRTAGHLFPELFRRQFTDKENEAVANLAKFSGQTGARALAGKDYQARMAAIFAECRRVLKPDGIMTLMFTHKATGAWDALTTGLIEAGFAITASWPINTEAGGSLHIRTRRRRTARSSSPAVSGRLRGCPKAAATGKTWSRWWPGRCGSVSRSSSKPVSAGSTCSSLRSARRSRRSRGTGRYAAAPRETVPSPGEGSGRCWTSRGIRMR